MRLRILGLLSMAFMAAPLLAATEALVHETGPRFNLSFSDHTLFLNKKNPDDPNGQPSNELLHELSVRGELDVYSLKLQTSNRLNVGTVESGLPHRPFVLEKETFEADWNLVNLKL